MKLWNPPAFFISLIMSLIMAVIFGIMTPQLMNLNGGLPWNMCIYLWPLRWLGAYLLITIIVQQTAFKLAETIFNFHPGNDKTGLWNPVAFFISLIMSLIMPIIFGIFLPQLQGLSGLSWEICIYMWPIRWLTAYLLVNIIVNPVGFKLAHRIFGFEMK